MDCVYVIGDFNGLCLRYRGFIIGVYRCLAPKQEQFEAAVAIVFITLDKVSVL